MNEDQATMAHIKHDKLHRGQSYHARGHIKMGDKATIAHVKQDTSNGEGEPPYGKLKTGTEPPCKIVCKGLSTVQDIVATTSHS